MYVVTAVTDGMLKLVVSEVGVARVIPVPVTDHWYPVIGIVGFAGFTRASCPGTELTALKVNEPVPELNGAEIVVGLA